MVQVVPFVSIIIPTRNRKEPLKAAIDSLFVQSYPKDRYEIIVIDNDSKDGTDAMISLFNSDAPCVLKYLKKKDEGPGISRNIGIKMAGGNIVAFTDDDCIADPYWLQNGVAKMVDGVGLVQGKTLPNPHQGKKMFARTIEIRKENGFYETCNIFYRKSVFDLVGGFSDEFCGLDSFGKPKIGGEDIDLGWRVKKAGWKSVFAEDAIVYHHVFVINPIKELLTYRKIYTLTYVLPVMVKKHPELRKSPLYYRFFFSKTTAFFDLFLVSVILGSILHVSFFLFTLPFIGMITKYSFQGLAVKKYYRGFALVANTTFLYLILFILLLFGSLRCRSIVL